MRFIDRRNCKSAFEKGESREIKSMALSRKRPSKSPSRMASASCKTEAVLFALFAPAALAPTRTSSLPLKKSMHLSKT